MDLLNGVMMHAAKSAKEPSYPLEYLLKVISIFKISICYDKDDVPYSLGIKYIKFNKVVGY